MASVVLGERLGVPVVIGSKFAQTDSLGIAEHTQQLAAVHFRSPSLWAGS